MGYRKGLAVPHRGPKGRGRYTREDSEWDSANASHSGLIHPLADAHYKSLPFSVFSLQAKREEKRLIQQLHNVVQIVPSKQTLPYDERLTEWENAENNIRAAWVEKGIWRDGWGTPWPMETMEETRINGVRARQRLTQMRPEGHWKHERKAKVRHEASRPYNQFCDQAEKESRWIVDQNDWGSTPGASSANLEEIALERVKAQWLEDGLWHQSWKEVPGWTWRHETPDPRLEKGRYFRKCYVRPEANSLLPPNRSQWPPSEDTSSKQSPQEWLQPEGWTVYPGRSREPAVKPLRRSKRIQDQVIAKRNNGRRT